MRTVLLIMVNYIKALPLKAWVGLGLLVALVATAAFILLLPDAGKGFHDPQVDFPSGMDAFKTKLSVVEVTASSDKSANSAAEAGALLKSSVTTEGSVVTIVPFPQRYSTLVKDLDDRDLEHTTVWKDKQAIRWVTKVDSSAVSLSGEDIDRIQQVLWSDWESSYDSASSTLQVSWVGVGLTTAGLDEVSSILESVSKNEVTVESL